MSYLVLARRYRPQTFDDVIGQDHISVTLQNAVKLNKLHHAYLFSGPRGTGKTSSARILAKAIRCLEPSDSGNPCNKCEACVQVDKSSSLDVIEIDAASNNGVENIRELRENVAFSATVGKYRVYIIDEVHMLSTAAFNALLKTLEEPPPHVIFILATTELHKIPATVQSRCQRFDFKKVLANKMRESLSAICQKEKIKIDEESMQAIINESEGCLRDAQSLLDRGIALCGNDIQISKLNHALGLMDRESFKNLLAACAQEDSTTALKNVHQLTEKGNDPKIIINRLTENLRRLSYFLFTDQFLDSDSYQQELLRELASSIHKNRIIELLDQCLKAQSQITTSSYNQLILENLVLKLSFGFAQTKTQQQVAAVSEKTTAKAKQQNADPTPTNSVTQSSVPPPNNENPAAPSAKSALKNIGPLEKYIKEHKATWTPVLASVVDIQKSDKELNIACKDDFAGRRLCSEDGKKLLKLAYPNYRITVETQKKKSVAEAPSESRYAIKKKQALEHPSVKLALKTFSGSRIKDSRVLDNKTLERRK